MSLDLEQYRLMNGLSYERLAKLIGINSKAQARTYALGMCWPQAVQMEGILSNTEGKVSIAAMHRRHVAFLVRAGRMQLSKSKLSEGVRD